MAIPFDRELLFIVYSKKQAVFINYNREISFQKGKTTLKKVVSGIFYCQSRSYIPCLNAQVSS